MKNVVILGVLAVLVVVVGYFMLFGTSEQAVTGETPDEQAQQVAPIPTEETTSPRLGSGTLEDLRLLGENMECTISYTDEAQGSIVEGTYFVSEGSMRGDFLIDAPDYSGKVVSSMIVDDQMMYVWSDINGQLFAVKMDLSLIEDSTVETNEPVKLDEEVNYNCTPWVAVDRTVFMPPNDVVFQDMSALMRTGMEYGTMYEGGGVPEGFDMSQF
ncbi:hypothetical protein KC906_04430, partial [Candidatus Kaiserbacteria bacterium]|nr:hypothetical protein [Candidatus Kaiserbacteria bacterium]